MLVREMLEMPGCGTLAPQRRLPVGGGEEVPVPLRATTSGDVGAPLVTVKLPLKLPTAVGLKVTCKVRLCADSSKAVPVQPLTLNGPVVVTPLTVRELAPALVRVTSCALLVVPTCRLAKASEVGVTFSAVVAVTAVPDRETWVGELGSLLVNDSTPLKVFCAVGVKVTL